MKLTHTYMPDENVIGRATTTTGEGKLNRFEDGGRSKGRQKINQCNSCYSVTVLICVSDRWSTATSWSTYFDFGADRFPINIVEWSTVT